MVTTRFAIVAVVGPLTDDPVVVLMPAPGYHLSMPTFSVIAATLLIALCAGILFFIARRQVRNDAFDRAETAKVAPRRRVFPLTTATELRERALGKNKAAKRVGTRGKIFGRAATH